MASWFSELFRGHEALLIALGSVSIITFAGTLLALPVLLVRIPGDYFLKSYSRKKRQGLRGFFIHFLKNLLGLLFAVIGFIMLFIPGQGLLTILAGFWLLDLPGKRKMEMRLIRNRTVYRGIDFIRRKAGRESLLLEEPAGEQNGEDPRQRDGG